MTHATRRQLLSLFPAATLLGVGSSLLAAKAKAPPAALLLPLTGPSAAIGLGMQRAAALAQVDPKAEPLTVFDTGGTPEGAAAAARLAVKRGARMILGPLFSGETAAVVAAVGSGFPVLSFSNDESLIGGGAFLLGITAGQSVSAILAYARRRGVRRVVAFGGTSPWSQQGIAAAQKAKDALGIDLVLLHAPLAEGQSLTAALKAMGKGELPDALLVTDGGDELAVASRALDGSAVQLLGSEPAANAASAGGAWVAASNPDAVADFASRYQARFGAAPGSFAALAFDGANIVRSIQAGGTVDRAALSSASAAAMTGAIRFHPDGTATRELAILVAGDKGYTVVDKSLTA